MPKKAISKPASSTSAYNFFLPAASTTDFLRKTAAPAKRRKTAKKR